MVEDIHFNAHYVVIFMLLQNVGVLCNNLNVLEIIIKNVIICLEDHNIDLIKIINIWANLIKLKEEHMIKLFVII